MGSFKWKGKVDPEDKSGTAEYIRDNKVLSVKLESFTVACELDKLIELCKKVNQPVFVIKEINYDRSSVGSIGGFTLIEVEDKIPKLKDIGFTSLVDPVKLFYDISFFMTNVLRDNPDVQPPVEVSDKDKIPQHGFDLKQSFRHRKE